LHQTHITVLATGPLCIINALQKFYRGNEKHDIISQSKRTLDLHFEGPLFAPKHHLLYMVVHLVDFIRDAVMK